jgi:hypothetical protein
MIQNWYSSIYRAFLIGSAILFIIYMVTKGSLSLGAMITGYSVLLFSIIMILYIIVYNVLQTTQKQSFFKSLLSMLFICGPFLLTFFIIGFVLYLVIKFKNKILLGRVSSGYNTFSNIIIILLLLQIYIVYNGINTDKFQLNEVYTYYVQILYLVYR